MQIRSSTSAGIFHPPPASRREKFPRGSDGTAQPVFSRWLSLPAGPFPSTRSSTTSPSSIVRQSMGAYNKQTNRLFSLPEKPSRVQLHLASNLEWPCLPCSSGHGLRVVQASRRPDAEAALGRPVYSDRRRDLSRSDRRKQSSLVPNYLVLMIQQSDIWQPSLNGRVVRPSKPPNGLSVYHRFPGMGQTLLDVCCRPLRETSNGR